MLPEGTSSPAMSSAPTERCPVCDSGPPLNILEIDSVPTHVGVLWHTRDAALACPRGDVRLAGCPTCGLLWNRVFDSARTTYEARYNISLHHSPTYQEYARALAYRLVRKHGLRGRTIVEIGSGQGEFLSLLCEMGDIRGLGFDPCYQPEGPKPAGDVTVIRDYFRGENLPDDVGLYCVRHVLEHLAQPRDLVTAIRRAIPEGAPTAVYFEVPNSEYIIHGKAVWNIFYEHCAYYGAEALAYLFGTCGFHVLEVAPTFKGQYLTITATVETPKDARATRHSHPSEPFIADARTFGTAHHERVAAWRQRLDDIRNTGSRVVAWGAGARAVSFFNALDIDCDTVPYVVDINPLRQGTYLAGTGQAIIAPDQLRQYQPDLIILTNPTFEREIRDQARSLGLTSDFCAI